MRLAVAAWLLAASWALHALVGITAVDGDRVTIALASDATARRINENQWATNRNRDLSFHTPHNDTLQGNGHQLDIYLVIGVKTNVLRGAAAREAIRDTWGATQTTRALGVRVWFVGCSPDLSALSDTDRTSALETIALEKATYQDLLTHELRCEDSVAGLVGKTIEFMHFADSVHTAQTAAPSPAYVMMTDDDVYVRVDSLTALLQADSLPRERLFAGNAATEEQRTPNAPERDPHSRFYVPYDAYPMTELPPFVSGAHYILSRDMVEFIARNREDLQGLDGLDDVTMALWMLALQVHPTFLDSFQVLQHAPCAQDLVSYAGLSQFGIHLIHANILARRAFCDEFSIETWRKVESADAPVESVHDTSEIEKSVRFEWDIQHDPASVSLHVQVDAVVQGQRASIIYVPSAGSYDAVFCGQLLELLRRRFSLVLSPSMCARHRRLLQHFITDQYTKVPSLRAKLEIARHNLARSEADEATGVASPVWTVVLSPQSSYSRVVLECLFSRLYQTHRVAVLNEAHLPSHAPPPDVFVFSVLDEGMRAASESAQSLLPPSGVAFVNKYGPTSHLLLISGESYRPQQLHPQVTLLSTVETPRHTKHVYLPYASAAFGEMVRHTPTQLLQPWPPVEASTSERRFCAYMYSNCGAVIRQHMFELVNAIDQADALGYCQGASRAPDESRLVGRHSLFYADDAVDVYRQYKFVIAFENTFTAPGYVTEKIVTAMLAGAVPIYYGHSESVSRLFNRDAFIDCGMFVTLQACADRVREIHNSPSEYESMRAAAPVKNRTAFYEFFSWHPSVADLAETDTQPLRISVAAQLKELLL